MDIVQPDYVQAKHFTGECASIKQVVKKNSVCLPIPRVTIGGAFGLLETEAAVSANLSKQYSYIFSNRSELLLKERGLCFREVLPQVITRSQVRERADMWTNDIGQAVAADHCEQESSSVREKESRADAPVNVGDSNATDDLIPSSMKVATCCTMEQAFSHTVQPNSESLRPKCRQENSDTGTRS